MKSLVFRTVFLIISGFLFLYASPTLAAAVSWDSGGANDDWETAANWSGDAVPTDADDVTIDYAETININATTTINSLTVGGTNATVLNFDYDALTAGALIIDAGALTVAANGTITHTVGSTTTVLASVYIDVQTGGADIDGSITTKGKGYNAWYGLGTTDANAKAAGYGGQGWQPTATSGKVYGSITAPVALGSGGSPHAGDVTTVRGGGAIRLSVAGTLALAGSITSDANDPSGGYCDQMGAGAGGSVYLDVGTLDGAGTITSRGGNPCSASTNGGGGGGGRIAIYYDANSSTITPTAYGGWYSGNIKIGGAGTVYWFDNAETYGDLTIDNNGHDSSAYDLLIGRTPLTPTGSALSLTLNTLTLSNDGNFVLTSDTTIDYTTLTWTGGNMTDRGGVMTDFFDSSVNATIPAGSYLYADTVRTFNSLTVNGVLTHSANSTTATYRINLTTVDYLTISGTGSVDVNAKGFAAWNGDGKPTENFRAAGHGGQGYNSTATQGVTYGSVTAPITLGSGGAPHAGDPDGVRGGGAVQLTVGGELTLTGTVSSNGATFSGGYCDQMGMGSGGSVYLDVGNLDGAGTITTTGGNPCATDQNGGGGGGGRVAIYYDTNTSTVTASAYGGWYTSSTKFGGAGTVYWRDNDDSYGDLTIDNNGHDNTTNNNAFGRTPLTPTGTPLSLTLDTLTLSNDGHLILTSDTTIECTTFTWTGGNMTDRGGVMTDFFDSSVNATIPAGSYLYADTERTFNSLTVDGILTHSQNYSSATYRINVTTVGNMTVSGTGSVNVSKKGFSANNGTGKADAEYKGSGHGGQGYAPSATSGIVYGDLTAPITLGSGGNSSAGDATTVTGGGAVQLTVGGELILSGTIVANASDGSGVYCDRMSNPSGGSVYLDVGTLSGAGPISARGGNPCNSTAYGGGGGRIAIYYDTNSSTVAATAYGGWITGGSYFGGAGTVYWKDTTADTDNLVIDNGGHDYTGSVYGNNRGKTALTNSGTPASFTFDTVTISNSGDLLLNSDTTIISTTNTWTGGDITDRGGTWSSLLTNLVIPTSARFYADTTRSVTSVVVNGTMTHSTNSTAETYKIDFTTTGDFTVGATGTINVDGYGFTGRNGTGTGADAGTYGSGGGYGGRGGATSDGGDTGGATYGSATAPTNIGSGGSGNNGTVTGGKSGGGAIKLSVGGNMSVGGEITADGGTEMTFGNFWENWGGGSGGSIWLDITGTISGTANITADGSGGKTTGDGAGGGGRIYITCSADSHSGSMSVITGAVGIAGGSGTATLVLETPPTTPTISSPLSGSYNNSLTPTITGSAYVSDVAHVSTDWKVVASADACSGTAVWESEHDAVNLTSITVGTALTASTTYKACVRYTNSFGDSSWSTAITFTTQFGGTSNTTTWDFDEGVVADNYDFDGTYVELDASGNSLARLKDLGAGVYKGAPLGGYTKGKEITVANNVATELTNYQTKVVVTYDADMQADFDDIRFTSSNGSTLIDYWLESKTDSVTATFWVEVPTIAASSSATIYMYYGNAGVSSASNIFNTFVYGDDFSDASWTSSNWTQSGTGFVLTAGEMYHSTTSEPSGTWQGLTMNSSSGFTDGIIEVKMKPANCGGSYGKGVAARYTDVNNHYTAGLEAWSLNKTHIGRRVGSGWALLDEDTLTCSTISYYKMKFILNGTALSLYMDDVLYSSATDASFSTGKVGLAIDNNEFGVGAYWDDFRVRKFAATEPTVTIGELESNISFSEITVAPSTAGTHPIYNELYGLGATTGTVEGSIGYNVSNDGTIWYYHNGTAWTVVTGETSQYNTLAQVDAYLYDFTSEIGDGEFYFKAFLISDSTQEVELDSLTLTYIGMPTVNWTTASQSGAEDAGTLTVTASLSFAYALDVTIPYTVTGTATGSGTDYSITASPLVVTAGSTTGSVTITVTNDVIDELDETVVVTMGTLTGGIKGTTDVHTATITDNDAAPTIAVSDVSVSEGASPGTVTVTMTGGSYLGTSVNYATSSGTATSGTDFTAASGTLTWAADATGDKTFTVTLSNDTLDEDDETVNLTLSVPVNATISDDAGVLTITDNDDPPTITFDSDTASGSEATTPAAFNVSLSAASGRTITATCATHAITATAGTDYTPISSTLTFSPGDTSKTVNITISNDALDENNETFSLHLNDYSNVTAGTYTADTYTITDNDDAPTVSWTTSTQSVTENATTATITAELSAVSGLTVTIPYTVTGTAAASGEGTDYSITASPITISAGSTTANVTVTVIEDAVVETDETVIATMGSPTNASTGATTVHTLTIANDDHRSRPPSTGGDSTPSTINLTSPTDSEQLIAGSFKTITWSSTGTFGFVNLAYSTDGGVTYQRIEDNLVNSGTYYWSIPNQSVTNGFIRIEGTDLASILTSDTTPFTTLLTETPSEEPSVEEIPTEEEIEEEISVIGMALESVLGGRWVNEAERNGIWEIFPDLPEEVSIGTLVKLPDDGDLTTQFDSAVYYIGVDKRRHAFPNEQVYKSWFSTFYGIKTIDSITMSNIPLGPMVTYRPGSTLIKFPSITKVYAIDSTGCLRWLTSEELAIDMYGPDWAKIIKDVSEAFWSSYCFGDDLVAANDQDWDTVIANY